MSTLKVDTLQNSVGENLVFGNKNLLINGGQNIWQRSTSTSVSTDTYSTVDRWRTTVNGLGVFTLSRSTDVPSGQGFGYSTKWDCTTADASPAAADSLKFEQRIEGQNLQHLLYGNSGAKKLTASFWVKSNKTGVYTCGLYSKDNSGRHIESSFTISSASTWEKKEITFDGDTVSALDNDNEESLRFWIWLGAGSNYSSGTHATSWAAYAEADVLANSQVNLADSTSNEFYITGCQLEVGSKATDFDFEPYERTLSKCQRYYISYGGNSAYERYAFGFYYTSTVAYCGAQFPVTMRANPSGSSSGSLVMLAVPNETISSISYTQLTPNSMILAVTTSGNTSGRGAVLASDNNTTSRLKIDAEL
jgi:hypothetical protein